MIYSVEVKYLGCYVDDLNRMLDYRELGISLLTLENCKQSCFRRNDKYLGLQASYACFCGNSFKDPGVYQKKTDSECSQPCLGNISQICGGQWRNSVYELITATVSTTTMTMEGYSTVETAEVTTNRQSVTTADITTLGQLDVTTTDMRTPSQVSVTPLQVTEPNASGVKTIKTTPIFGKSEINTVQPISPLECLCPCSKVVTGKWHFLREMNLTLDQLREVMKPDLDLMKKELSVNKFNTTRIKRSKISAPDYRISATSVGYVEIVFICLITVLIVFIDILGCFVAKFKRRF